MLSAPACRIGIGDCLAKRARLLVSLALVTTNENPGGWRLVTLFLPSRTAFD